MNWTTIKVRLSDIGIHLALFQDDQTVLIDAGPADSVKIDLPKKLDELSVREVDYLILTHGHTDHVGGAKWIKDRYGATVIAHPDAVEFIADPEYELKNYWSRYLRFFADHFRLQFEEGYWKIRGRDSCEVDKKVREGDTLNIGSLRFKFLETPGHIVGSLSIQEESLGILCVGDAVQGLGPCSTTASYVPLYFDVRGYVKSLEKLSKVNVERLLCAHPYKPLCKPVQSRDEAKRFIESSLNFVRTFDSLILETISREGQGIAFTELGRRLSGKFNSEWPSIGLTVTLWSHIEWMLKRELVEVYETPSNILIASRNTKPPSRFVHQPS